MHAHVAGDSAPCHARAQSEEGTTAWRLHLCKSGGRAYRRFPAGSEACDASLEDVPCAGDADLSTLETDRFFRPSKKPFGSRLEAAMDCLGAKKKITIEDRGKYRGSGPASEERATEAGWLLPQGVLTIGIGLAADVVACGDA